MSWVTPLERMNRGHSELRNLANGDLIEHYYPWNVSLTRE